MFILLFPTYLLPKVKCDRNQLNGVISDDFMDQDELVSLGRFEQNSWVRPF
jgi:hypothetical protein